MARRQIQLHKRHSSQYYHSPSEECIERKVGYKHAIQELRDAREHEEEEECVNEFETVGCLVIVCFPECLNSICGRWRLDLRRFRCHSIHKSFCNVDSLLTWESEFWEALATQAQMTLCPKAQLPNNSSPSGPAPADIFSTMTGMCTLLTNNTTAPGSRMYRGRRVEHLRGTQLAINFELSNSDGSVKGYKFCNV